MERHLDLDEREGRRERRSDLIVLAAALGTPKEVAEKLLAWAADEPPAPLDEAAATAAFLHKDRYFWRRKAPPRWVPMPDAVVAPPPDQLPVDAP